MNSFQEISPSPRGWDGDPGDVVFFSNYNKPEVLIPNEKSRFERIAGRENTAFPVDIQGKMCLQGIVSQNCFLMAPQVASSEPPSLVL